MKVVGIASGFYNPLTVAHIRMLQCCKNLVDHLVVVVNNDEQVKLKGSIPFYSEHDRLEIIQSLSCVDEAIMSVDNEWTIENTIARLMTSNISKIQAMDDVIFMNGGDRVHASEEELRVCKEYDILTIYGVGGYDKPRSSSTAIENAVKEWNKRNLVQARSETYEDIARRKGIILCDEKKN
jgi:cytidyltransferase-like protein